MAWGIIVWVFGVEAHPLSRRWDTSASHGVPQCRPLRFANQRRRGRLLHAAQAAQTHDNPQDRHGRRHQLHRQHRLGVKFLAVGVEDVGKGRKAQQEEEHEAKYGSRRAPLVARKPERRNVRDRPSERHEQGRQVVPRVVHPGGHNLWWAEGRRERARGHSGRMSQWARDTRRPAPAISPHRRRGQRAAPGRRLRTRGRRTRRVPWW